VGVGRAFYGRCGKRALDLILSALAVVALSLLFLLIALAVRTRLGSPVLFRQDRCGLNGRVFSILKFRSMRDARDASGALLPDADRLDAFGRFLRRTSVDEWPELLNVIAGDMSLVGPRPLMAKYRERYTPEQNRRHDVRPGITGWAQVTGRNTLTWEQKFRLDLWYVDQLSFWMDLRILARTAIKMATGEGISEEGEATAREFTGS
jgi:lipopolysaccharide/colanic/teichoic acid biosynthesis glycosyltransferase